MLHVKETTVVVIAANTSEKVQRVELAGPFDWHSVGEVRRAVARTVKCGGADISLDQWDGEEWVSALQDPAAFKYYNNSFGADALFRWERVVESQDEDELLCVRRVMFCEQESVCAKEKDEGLSCARKVGGCELSRVAVANERVEAVEAELKGMRGAMAELSLLVEKSIQTITRQAVEKVTVSDESVSGGEGLGASGEEVRPGARGVTRYRHIEVLVRAYGVSFDAVVMAMRRSGMRVAGVSGKRDVRGVCLIARLREGQTERGWMQEWRGRVMKRSGVPWRAQVVLK
jgi:hypothetical protein